MNETFAGTKVIGHRGSAGTHPENTMLSFQEAHRVGADAIEFDVQVSHDGVPVVIHDEKVDRTTNGSGWVKDLTFEELQRLDAGSWKHESFAGAQIPALSEVLAWAKDTELFLNIELKTGVIQYPQLEELVIRQVEAYGLQNRVILSSFNHYSLVEAHRINPDIETAILFMEGLYEPWNYARQLGASGLHCYWPIATVPQLVQGAHAAQMPLRPFTVNEDEYLRTFMQHGLAVFTDYPEKALAIRAALHSPQQARKEN